MGQSQQELPLGANLKKQYIKFRNKNMELQALKKKKKLNTLVAVQIRK